MGDMVVMWYNSIQHMSKMMARKYWKGKLLIVKHKDGSSCDSNLWGWPYVVCIRQNYKGEETINRQNSLLVKRDESKHEKRSRRSYKRTGEREKEQSQILLRFQFYGQGTDNLQKKISPFYRKPLWVSSLQLKTSN